MNRQTRQARVLFFGYSEVGYACLELLIRRNVNVVAVFTHSDHSDETQWFRSVAALARENKIPVYTPESLKDPRWTALVRELEPDLLLSLYYRNIIPESIFKQAKLGAYNMHGSYLPRYRGRAPLNWAIIHGEDHTGVSLHVMEKSADTGDIVDQEKVPIGPRQTAGELTPKVRDAAVAVLSRQLDALLAGKAPRTPQDASKATYFGKRTPADGLIDWTKPSRDIFNLVRAVTRPFPGAFTFAPTGQRLNVWWAESVPTQTDAPCGTILSLSPLKIRTQDGALEITQGEWTPETPALKIGDKLGAPPCA